jgi:ABC-type sugar transport system, ATPase component
LKNGEGPILVINNISKAFPGVKALDNVSIEIPQGVVYGIVGENGAGKSTLMKILSGVYTKDSGTIEFNGELIEHSTPIQALKRGLSIIYQEFNLVNTMTVGENIFLGRFKENHGMRGTHKKARDLLDSIGSTIDTYTLIENLSASEMQMVEIAKALSFESKLIIMDEPSSSLTSGELKLLGEIINQLRDRGISIIYISHKLDEIFEYCNIVTIMRDGKVIDTKPIEQLTRSEMIAKMVGRKMENEYPPRAHFVGEPLLEVKNLNTNKLHNINFTLHKGEILGLVGLVGAGRTEIIRALYGADDVKTKEVSMDGKKVNIKSPRDAKNLGMGLVPEDRKQQGLILRFSVESNITMAALDRLTKIGFLDSKLEKKIAWRQVKNLSIKTSSLQTKVVTLSGGNQQKCVVGRWLELSPKVLILDEPTRGIDVGAKYEIYVLMNKIVEQGGAIIIISSELPEVLSMSNRVLTICDGHITGEFNPEEISAMEIMDKAIG